VLLSDNSSPTFGPIRITQVTDVELQQFAELIYRRTGIRIPPQKKLLLSNRLRRRLKSTGIADFGDYYRHLKRLHAEDGEWDALLQEVTTHETYLFRDERQWDWFRGVYLPERMNAARQHKIPRALRIWSAACSTGDEPMTIACCIAGCLSDPLLWRIQIVATDIGVGALADAKQATFGQRAMHNLMEPLGERPFDLVLLKNVLIYFDAVSKTTVLNHVRRALVPGGLLLAGAAEGISNMVPDLERLEPWLFRKPTS
jgi:chemotaxis protein methyltransferase CheR